MSKSSEIALDAALDEALQRNAGFVSWLLSQTKFAGLQARYHWSRADNPWGTIAVTLTDPLSGESSTSRRESETDVLVVFATNDGFRFALHIENKLASGSFTPEQPEMYPIRAEQWKGLARYENYQDWETVLVAPRAFYERNKEKADMFNRYISHESIAEFIPEFGAPST
jgi:hypothetical protein